MKKPLAMLNINNLLETNLRIFSNVYSIARFFKTGSGMTGQK